MKDASEYINKNAKQILLMADFTDSTISNDVNDYLKSDETKAIQKFYIKQGIVGIRGIKKMILNIYNTVAGSNAKAFDTQEEAIKYLTT